MRIIDRVDINYFRSVYSASLTRCGDINVLTGANDSGKSNVLKSLNLFFNGEAEPHTVFDFIRDLNRNREEEARSAKGRMTIWMKVYFNNFLGWNSLPNRFWIKRVWNRYDDRSFDTYPDDIPATTIGRFLNKIRYHYVPAVRSREIFSDLLGDLHDALILDESAGLRASSEVLVNDLNEITEGMSAEIFEKLGIESTVNIPERLRDLFRALDFSTRYGDFEIPLILRGDGIQSRHLPFILSYIASRSNQHHIWGYEEPENSLELSRAFEMASDFAESFCEDNQIFLTTHSPAFYDIDSDKASKWFVENREQDGRKASRLTSITSTAQVDKSMGLLSVITPRIREIYNGYEELQDTVSDMERRLREAECPVVYVEGPSDVVIFERARSALRPEEFEVRFESANGAGNLTPFLKSAIRVKPDDRPLLGIYDFDSRGRREMGQFRNYHFLPETELRTLDARSKIYAGMLIVPEHLEEAELAFRNLGVDIPLSIEYMFNRNILDEAIEAGVLELEARNGVVANDELPLSVSIDDIIRGRVDQGHRYLAKKVSDDCKANFSEWIVAQPDYIFEPFSRIFAEIETALNAE